MKFFNCLILSFLFFFASCSKDENQIITTGIPFVPTSNVFMLESIEDSVFTSYKYSNTWRISEIQTEINTVPDEKIVFEKVANVVTKTTNKNNYVYKFFLNKKGFADSLNIVKIGFVNIMERYIYNGLGFLEKKMVQGLVLNVPFYEETNYLYSNGNLIKSEQISDNGNYTVSYEYYLDSTNFFAGTIEATTFLPQSKNLIKKEIGNDDTFNEYSYSLNEDSTIVITQLNELSQIYTKTIKLIHL